MTRSLYRPHRDHAPDGDGLPRGGSPAAVETRQQIEETLLARVHRPLHATDDQYGELVHERMRAMTLIERIDIEIEQTQRFARSHTADYDPLKY